MERDLNNDFYKLVFMTELTIEVLKKIVDKLPEDYTVEFDDGGNSVRLADKVEIDVSLEKLILKKY